MIGKELHPVLGSYEGTEQRSVGVGIVTPLCSQLECGQGIIIRKSEATDGNDEGYLGFPLDRLREGFLERCEEFGGLLLGFGREFQGQV